MSRRIIYITHCSARKDLSLKDINKRVTPDKLYTATPTQRFMNKSKENDVNWAIFSDKYGVWFNNIKNRWYEKSPNSVTDEQFKTLVADFNTKLKNFDEIWFYYNPGRFHPLYRKLLNRTSLKDKVTKFTHLTEIGRKDKIMTKNLTKIKSNKKSINKSSRK
jgi:hypothetical protein